MAKNTFLTPILLGTTLLLSGCGQSGPLYLPKSEKPKPAKASIPIKNTNNPPPLRQTGQVEDA